DDLGAGTDPAEGSALARALLSHLRGRQVTTFVSTHYPELKVYAHATPGVKNACVEFDVETLSPTYKLTIGLPGMSNALAISDHLGLPTEILDEARELVSPESLETEALLSEIKRAHQEALEAREAAKASWSRAEGLERELRERLAGIEEEGWEVLRAAREEARKEIAEVRRELAGIRAGLASLASRERLEQAEEKLSELEQKAAPPKPPPRAPAGPLHIGDTVWVKGLEATGEITALFEEEAEVQIGRFKAKVEKGELEPRLSPEESGGRELVILPTVPSPGSELNVRGQTVEEMLPRLEKYLNDAYLAGLGRVHILHGKGTGTLRRAVRERLNNHPLVAGWSPGGPHEGNEGVTVVELAK
ncbi:MAG: Smr/MutS family protein, partial [Chloroflexota bacterium]|nr:Smr/MutS family protein [Chloroflexota bacterium]